MEQLVGGVSGGEGKACTRDIDDTGEASVDGEGGSGTSGARKYGSRLGSSSRWEGNCSVGEFSALVALQLWGVCVAEVLCAEGSRGSRFHSIAASSSVPSERFNRPRKRLEERRDKGEEDLVEEVELLRLFNAEVMICNAPDAGRLPMPPVSDSSSIGVAGGTAPVPLNLRPRKERSRL